MQQKHFFPRRREKRKFGTLISSLAKTRKDFHTMLFC